MDNDEQLLLSLKAWPTLDPASNSIAALLPRVQIERGSFRDTTEAKLEAEIAAGIDGTLDTGEATVAADEEQNGIDEDDEGKEKAAADEKRREELNRGKEEIIREISMAHNEALLALDFISLIVSLHNPDAGFSTMSPNLRNVAPVGSLGVEKVTIKVPPQVAQEDRLISQGWKLEGLNSAADSMIKAAGRLKIESEKERRYWEQILSIRDEGWTICKLPRERNTLGVRYGFAEASPEFKERGVGALRRAEDGSIDMEDINAYRAARRAVRVRIIENGQVTGQSRPSCNRTENPTLKDKIETARDFIFEEELFFEIMREARNLANHGIKTSEDLVTIELKAGKSIQIDMIPIEAEDPPYLGPSDDLAQALSLTLHILLSYGHRVNLKRRSKPQPPMLPRKPPPPPLLLLRPITTHLVHQDSTSHFLSFINNLKGIASSAGLLPSSTISTASNQLFLILHPLKGYKPKSSTQADVEEVIEQFLGILETEAILEFPGGWRVVVLIRSVLTHPFYGTGYLVTASHDGVSARLTGRNIVTSTSELESYLLWCLERGVVNAIRLAGGEEKAEEVATGKDGKAEGTWQQIAQGNSMERSDGKGVIKRITVAMTKSGLHLRWGQAGGRDKEVVWSGSGSGGGGAPRTLWDVLSEI